MLAANVKIRHDVFANSKSRQHAIH